MSFLIKDAIHGALVESIYFGVISRRSNFYYYIGKVLPWDDPFNPDEPLDTQTYEYNVRNEIIAVKKIQPSDLSFVVRRINWITDTIYDQFDGDYSSTFPSSTGAESLKQSNFYVISSDFNVYKCLFNNNGAISTFEPVGTDVVPIVTADGYIWKYLYTIPLSIRNRFLTTDFMPVQTSVFNTFYTNGEIDNVIIDNKGSGYFGNSEVTLQVNGEFAGSAGNAIANIVPVFNQAGSVIDVIIRDQGNNYISANIAVVDLAGTGTGLYNTASTANFIPVLFNTKLDRVLIADPGINYRSDIRTTLSLIGDGIGATLVPFVNTAGELEDVVITSRGQGYTFLDIEVEGDGTDANVFAELSTGDLDTNQSSVELSAVSGAIHAFRILNRGNNYTSANIIVTGDGTGFAGNVVLSNTNTISQISVTNPGQGYTYANVQIIGNGSNAIVQAILPPQGGHGKNAIKELFADTLIFFSTINNERIHDVDVSNDYRQFGLIKNIKQFGNERTFANVNGTTCFLVTSNTLTNSLAQLIEPDTVLELFSDRTRKFEVVETVTSNNRMLLTSLNNYNLLSTDVLYDPITDSSFPLQSVNAQPTINKFSGDLIFIDNRTKVSYSDQQLVTLRTTIKL